MFGHFDDTDAQLYQVVIRQMAAQGAWMDPSYLRQLLPHLREHLPFGFWPFAAAVAIFGEPAGKMVGAIFSLTTLVGVFIIGRRMLGTWPAVLATLVLATTDTFFRYGAATRLDPVLMLLANAAAAPILLGAESAGAWVAAISAAALATLVKGPFGLVPFVAAAAARSWGDRSRKPLLIAATGAVLASAPLIGFLLIDRSFLHAGWWDVYFRLQVLGSATGLRTDGETGFWYPFVTIAGRFWPGLPFVAYALILILRRRTRGPDALLAMFCSCMLLALCLPGRKVWNHELVAYPGLALLAGASCLPIQDWLQKHAKRAATALVAAALATVVASPWIGRIVNGRPCVGSTDFATQINVLPPGETILVVSRPTSWRTLASLAAERRLEPVPLETLPEAASTSAQLAMVEAESAPHPLPAGWEQISRARGWLLLRRRE